MPGIFNFLTLSKKAPEDCIEPILNVAYYSIHSFKARVDPLACLLAVRFSQPLFNKYNGQYRYMPIRGWLPCYVVDYIPSLY